MFKYQRKSHSKYSIKYHFVFCTKYRRQILTGLFAEYVKELMVEKTKDQFTIDEIEVDKDHIHVLVESDPTRSPLDFVRLAKMVTTYHAWRSNWSTFLRSVYWKERTLWSDGYFVATTGQASTETIRQYIESQG
jgi:putative transposase